MRITSYQIPIDSRFEINLPVNARILAVYEQRGEPRLWVIADEQEREERRRFYVAGSETDIELLASLMFLCWFALSNSLIEMSDNSS